MFGVATTTADMVAAGMDRAGIGEAIRGATATAGAGGYGWGYP